MLAVVIGTGMRQGEILGLRVQHVNFLRRQLSVEEQRLTPSTGSTYLIRQLKTPASRRLLPLPQFTIDSLSHHLAVHDARDDGVIFRNPNGGLWRRGVSVAMEKSPLVAK